MEINDNPPKGSNNSFTQESTNQEISSIGQNIVSKRVGINRFGIVAILIVVFVMLIISGTAIYFFLPKSNNPTEKQNSSNRVSTNDNTQNNIEPNPKIEILATLPPEDPHILYNVLFDPYSHIAVYSIDKDQYTATSSSTIVVNGVSGKTYSGSDLLTISPDGKRVAYVAEQDDKQFVVVDGVEGKKYDYIKNLKFSPDGQHIVYAAGEGKHIVKDDQFSAHEETTTSFIVVDTTEGKKYDGMYVEINVSQTYDPFFSKDGKKATYTAIKNGKNIIVVDDKELSDYSNQQYPQFIGSSYDLIYLVPEVKNYFLVVAGQKKTVREYISDINDSPYYIGKDATQIAYEATDKDIRNVIVNDSTSYPITSGVLQDIVFSGSGRYVAYYTGTWISKDLYVNGKLFDNIQPNATITTSSPLFSPDEHLLVYSEYRQKEQNGTVHIISVDPLQKILDFPLKGFSVIDGMRFSDDGKHIYFKGWQDRKIVFVTINVDQLIKGKTDTPITVSE